MQSPHNESHDSGRIVIPMIFSVIAALFLGVFIDTGLDLRSSSAQATSTATTTVTVLNTAPQWTVYAYELYESSTSTPTNSGTSTVWAATATDSNGESWYLLICKSSSTPIAGTSTSPSCGGGLADRWAVGGPFTSASQGTTSTSTTESFAEKNDWFAYVCDGNGGAPRCNGIMWSGNGSATSSPFMVNHRPSISAAADTSPANPGTQVDWTTTADDADSVGGDDTIKLHVCKAQDFNTTVPYMCGAGGFWASSTFTTSNPAASTTLPIPSQDGNRGAYVYIIDEHNHPALTVSYPWHSSSTILTVSNVAPYIASSTIELYDVFGSTTLDTTLALTTQEGQTSNFVVRFDVTDENSCLTVASGNEITDVDINIFRSGIGGAVGAGCDSSLEYNANDCYTHTNGNFIPTCTQRASSCTANDWNNITWECTFPLWYIADPTDVGSVYAGEDWRSSARATDDGLNGVGPATGNYSTEDEAANNAAEMTQFLSFRATGSPIAYGSFEPGFGSAYHPATTTVYSTGNTGLDHYLSGDPMCPGYPTCSGNSTSTIYVPFQHYATTSSSFTYGFQLGIQTFELSTSTSPVLVDVDILKPQATTSPTDCTVAASCDETYWGIFVPGTITFAGNYIGRNYIDAAIAPSSEW